MMALTLEPKVTLSQELLVPRWLPTLADMDEKMAFARRLNELCDDMGIPPKGENRQAQLGGVFNVTQKGARKWLEGEGFPSYEKLVAIARWGKVNIEWLATGRGEKSLQPDPDELRPDIKRLLKVAEEWPPYKIDQAIKIMAAIDDSKPGDGQKRQPHQQQSPPKRKAG